MKKYNPIFVLLICLAFITNIRAQAPLENYMKTAGENNTELKAAFNGYLAALEQIPQVGTLPDPQVAFGIFLQPVETRVGAQRFNASVSQMFPWFGTLNAKKDVASQMAKAKYEEFVDAKVKLYQDVGLTYNQLYYLQKSIDITGDNLDILASFKELARINFEGGRTAFVNVLRVEMEEQELADKLKLYEDQKRPLGAKFQQLLNADLEQDVALPDSLWKEPLFYSREMVLDSVMGNNPRLKRLDNMEKAYENQEEVAKKMGLPSFNIGVNYINVAPRNNLSVPLAGNGKDALVFPQVGISIPLYRKKYKAMRKEASLKKDEVAYTKENTVEVLKTKVEELFKDYQDAQRRIELNNRLADISRRSLGLLQTEFSNGNMDFVELLRMERKVLNYKLEEQKARVDLNNAVYNINYLMGK